MLNVPLIFIILQIVFCSSTQNLKPNPKGCKMQNLMHLYANQNGNQSTSQFKVKISFNLTSFTAFAEIANFDDTYYKEQFANKQKMLVLCNPHRVVENAVHMIDFNEVFKITTCDTKTGVWTIKNSGGCDNVKFCSLNTVVQFASEHGYTIQVDTLFKNGHTMKVEEYSVLQDNTLYGIRDKNVKDGYYQTIKDSVRAICKNEYWTSLNKDRGVIECENGDLQMRLKGEDMNCPPVQKCDTDDESLKIDGTYALFKESQDTVDDAIIYCQPGYEFINAQQNNNDDKINIKCELNGQWKKEDIALVKCKFIYIYQSTTIQKTAKPVASNKTFRESMQKDETPILALAVAYGITALLIIITIVMQCFYISDDRVNAQEDE